MANERSDWRWLALLGLLAWGTAGAYGIDDFGAVHYEGYDDHGKGDVIGDRGLFEIYGANVRRSGGWLTVDIFTNFAGRADDGLFARYTTGGRGIGYGDLFLSAGWNPHGTIPYPDDHHANGNLWSYGFVLWDRWSANGGSGTLYELAGATNDANALLSGDFMTGSAIWRDHQEVAVDTAGPVRALANGGSWSIFGDGVAGGGDDFLRFVLDVRGTSLADAPYIGLHWGMTCANDVIEGVAYVPEPHGTALLAAGLLALGGTTRGRTRRRSQQR